MSELGGDTEGAVSDDGGASEADARQAAIDSVAEAMAEETSETIEAIERADPLSAFKKEMKALEGKIEGKPVTIAEKKDSEEEAEDEDEITLAKAMRQREKLARRRQEAASEADNIRSEAIRERQEAQRMLDEARSAAQAIAKLKSDPMEAIKALGLDPEDFIYGLVSGTSPEAKERAKKDSLAAELEDLKKWRNEQEQERVRALQRQQLQHLEAKRQDVIGNFKTLVSEENCPVLSSMYDYEDIVAMGDKVADKYRDLTGKEASLKEIAEYLEQEAEARYGNVARKKSAKSPAPPVKVAAPPKNLSRESSSERRALRPIVSDSSDDEERRDAAVAAVQAMWTAAGKK
jgi:hypothetical protein